jgi:hypothetical protein
MYMDMILLRHTATAVNKSNRKRIFVRHVKEVEGVLYVEVWDTLTCMDITLLAKHAMVVEQVMMKMVIATAMEYVGNVMVLVI